MAPSCKIELARFSARLRIQDGAECGNTIQQKTKQNYIRQQNIRQHSIIEYNKLYNATKYNTILIFFIQYNTIKQNITQKIQQELIKKDNL